VALMMMFIIELHLLTKSGTIQLTRKRKLTVALVFTVNLIFLYFLAKQIFQLQNNNELNFGGQNNFIDNILTILLHRSIYLSYYGEQFWITVRQIVIGLFAISIVYTICCSKYSSFSRITILLFLMIFATIMQHYTFNAFYPPERSSLIYITLFGLFIYYLFSDVYFQIFSQKIVKIGFNTLILLMLCLPLGYHFVKSLNLKYTKEWKYDANTKNVMKMIAEQHEKDNSKNRKISVSSTWIFIPSIDYYRDLYSMDYLTPTDRNGITKNSDFVYCTKEEKEKLFADGGYSIVEDFKDTESFLLSRSK